MLSMLAGLVVLGITQSIRGHLAQPEPLFVVDEHGAHHTQSRPDHIVAEARPRQIVAPPVAAVSTVAAPRVSVAPSTHVAPVVEHRQFNGRPIRAVKTIRMRVTAYCPCGRCCGRHADYRTASGYSVWVNRGKLVAADTRVLPFGSIISVPGYDDTHPVPVLDRGGKIKGNRLDVLFPTHKQAMAWGTKWLDVTVWEFADE
jgi:3D (Asp-Asp-Asp) domain-containing protein